MFFKFLNLSTPFFYKLLMEKKEITYLQVFSYLKIKKLKNLIFDLICDVNFNI